MNISRSLKIYILFAVISMGAVTVLTFSTLAANYFVQGLDISVRYTMQAIGQDIVTKEFPPQKVLDYDVASSWNELPQVVQDKIKPLKKHMTFDKYLEKESWWETPSLVIFVLRYDHSDKSSVYISKVINTEDIVQGSKDYGVPHLIKIILFAVGGIVLFSALLILLLRQVAKPMIKLVRWAEELNSDVLKKSTPDFHYCELNYLAHIVTSSLQSVQTSLDREKKFLSHASHELRTPISVVRSNTELMLKLVDKRCSVEKQRVVLDRIMRAGYSMTELCETLLWLNRGEYQNLPVSSVELSSVLEQLVHDLQYLLKEKQVNVYTRFDAGEYEMPITLARIVLGNLIRNAFQHTQCGTVEIVQKGQRVTISNREKCAEQIDNDLGFGLGLELTERIIRQYKWCYQVKELPNGRDVEIEFVNQQSEESPS